MLKKTYIAATLGIGAQRWFIRAVLDFFAGTSRVRATGAKPNFVWSATVLAILLGI